MYGARRKINAEASNTTLALRLAPGGGQAVRIRPVTGDDVGKVPTYQP